MKSLYESILDTDKEIVDVQKGFIKFVDQSVDILYKHLNDFKKKVFKNSSNQQVYQFSIEQKLRFVEYTLKFIDNDMNFVRTRYRLQYDKTTGSLIFSYTSGRHNLTILIVSGTNNLFPMDNEKVTSFITVEAYNGTYQGYDYKTDPESEELFVERMNKKFKFRS